MRVSNLTGHVTHWSCDHVILKKTFARIMATNFSKVSLKSSWPQPSSHVAHVSCITLYSQKCAFPVSQGQLPLNLVGLWVRVKRPHLLFQVTCRSSDHAIFEKSHVSANARPQIQLDISNIEKLTNQKLFFRSSHPEVFLGKGVLKICNKFAVEHPCRSASSAWVFSCKFAAYFHNTFS